MTHKFKVGEKVRIKRSDLSIYGCIGEVLNVHDQFCAWLEPVYYIKIGEKNIPIFENELEKIQQPKTESVYSVGDRVIFYFTENEVKIGTIEEIDTFNTYKVLMGNSYYIISENDIISASKINTGQKQCKFKEGEEVWIKGKISPLFDKIIDDDGDLRIQINGTGHKIYLKPDKIYNILSPKNEWISMADRLPPTGELVEIMPNFKHRHLAKFNYKEWIFEINGTDKKIIPSVVTHWKPLDAPPSE